MRTDRSPIRFLDPSVGTGAFFAATRRVFSDVDRALGVELDPAFANAARSVWGRFGLEVEGGDFTRIVPTGPRSNLILANPPYVRHHHLDKAEKRRLAEAVASRLGLDVGGLSGLYVYFLLMADAWLDAGGLAVWLVPSEFLDVNYGRVVRDYLATRVTLLHVHRFRPSDAQFDDALVTSAVVAFEKTPPRPNHQARFSFGGSLETPDRSRMVPVETLRSSRKWSRLVDEAPSPTLGPTLGDLFTVRRGIATGSNAFFILDRVEATAIGISDRFLTPILPSPRHLSEAVIEADPDGHPRLDRSMVLVDTDRPEAELRQVAPGLADYLESGRDRGLPLGYLASHRTPWYAQEHREPAPFLCTYMARPRPPAPPFRFFWNRSRATAPNVFLLLYPRGELKLRLDARPELMSEVFDRLRAIPARHLQAEGRVYGGGLHKIEPRELAALPAGSILDGLGDFPESCQQPPPTGQYLP